MPYTAAGISLKNNVAAASLDLRGMLVKVSAGLSAATQFVSSIASAEVSGGTYARQQLTGASAGVPEIVTVANGVDVKADDVVMGTLPMQAEDLVFVVYDEGSGSDATRTVLSYHPLAAGERGDGQIFLVRWSVSRTMGQDRIA